MTSKEIELRNECELLMAIVKDEREKNSRLLDQLKKVRTKTGTIKHLITQIIYGRSYVL